MIDRIWASSTTADNDSDSIRWELRSPRVSIRCRMPVGSRRAYSSPEHHLMSSAREPINDR